MIMQQILIFILERKTKLPLNTAVATVLQNNDACVI